MCVSVYTDTLIPTGPSVRSRPHKSEKAGRNFNEQGTPLAGNRASGSYRGYITTSGLGFRDKGLE